MTVKDLKRHLEKFDENKRVIFSSDEEGNNLMKDANFYLEEVDEGNGISEENVVIYPQDYISN